MTPKIQYFFKSLSQNSSMKPFEWSIIILVVLGTVHLGLVGVFNFNFLELLLGTYVRVAYAIIGLAGFYLLYWASQK